MWVGVQGKPPCCALLLESGPSIVNRVKEKFRIGLSGNLSLAIELEFFAIRLKRKDF